MAGAGQIPMMNTAGINQTSPAANPIMKTGGIGTTIPGSPINDPTQNPYMPTNSGGNAGPMRVMPMGTSPTPTGGPIGTVPSAGGLDPSGGNTFGSTGGLDKQLKDIWGKGVGGALGKLLEGMSGTDSKILQDYIASLGPEFAQQAAGVATRLGAGGVSANSSVNAIAQSNLASQENSLIANESAKLTMSQEDLTAQILMSMMNPASKEVATSGWNTFANVMNNITGDIGNLMGGSYQTTAGQGSSASPVPMSAPQLTSGGVSSAGDMTMGGDLQQFPDLSMFPS